MPKFKFKSARKKNKINMFTDKSDIYSGHLDESHIELFSNKTAFLDGCRSILEYDNDYIKLKIKKGIVVLCGNNFLISIFEGEHIEIKGEITSIEFCV